LVHVHIARKVYIPFFLLMYL